ncbi:MAG: hypothetical protein IJ581_01875 [Paludibacteraceae bacterium]|nr:hypothetical protein [Paludibacteraceae bacterium]
MQINLRFSFIFITFAVVMKTIRQTLNVFLCGLVALLMPGCKAQKSVAEADGGGRPSPVEVRPQDPPILVKYGVPPQLRREMLPDTLPAVPSRPVIDEPAL